MIGINAPLAPVRIGYVAWHTPKNTRRAAAKLLDFGRLIDEGSFAKYGGRTEAVVREYWKQEMPHEPPLCNHNSRKTVANWSLEVKLDYLKNWGSSQQSSRLSPLPFMVISQLGKEMREMGKSGGDSAPQSIQLPVFVQTAIKPIFEAMARNLFSFAGVEETA